MVPACGKVMAVAPTLLSVITEPRSPRVLELDAATVYDAPVCAFTATPGTAQLVTLFPPVTLETSKEWKIVGSMVGGLMTVGVPATAAA